MRPAPLLPVLVISFLYSLGTAVLWNGLAFVTKEQYGFGESANLWLAVYNGLTYAIAAFASGPLLRKLNTKLSTRGVISIVFIAQAALCPLVITSNSTTLLLIVTGSMSVLSAFFWPVIEAWVSSGRNTHGMRSAIGWWNIVWMTAIGIGMIAIAPLIASGNAKLAIAALAPINLACLGILLTCLPKTVPVHREHQPHHSPPDSYRYLLASSRALLPTSYALIGALSPIMPYLLDELNAPLQWQTPLAAIWMFSRVAGVSAMWAIPYWHGRWATILTGALMLLTGFATTVTAPTISILCLGLIAFGLGQAIIYYGALYYVMSVGEADVDAAGTHEGLIGMGYGIGPAAALGGLAIGGGGWIVVSSFCIPALAIWPSLKPFLKQHRQAEINRPS